MDHEIVQVVLEHEVDRDGADRIRVIGVFGKNEQLPPAKPGRTRNVVSVFRGVEMDTPAFRLSK